MVKMLQGAVDGVFDKEYQERVVKLNKKNTSGVRGTARHLRYSYGIKKPNGRKDRNYSKLF